MTELDPQPTFRVTTHYDRRRGEPGLRSLASQRLTVGQALDWVLREIPDDAWTVDHTGPMTVSIAIDWGKVHYRDGKAAR